MPQAKNFKLTKDVQMTFVSDCESIFTRMKQVDGCNNTSRVIRGYGKCASGYFEDALASMIYKNIVCDDPDYFALVDWPIVLGKQNKQDSSGKAKQLRLDFVLAKKCSDGALEIVYIAELKNNLGFRRNAIQNDKICLEQKDRLDQLKSARMHLSSKRIIYGSNGRQKFVIAQDIKFDLIVYSSCNSGSSKKANGQNPVRALASRTNKDIGKDEVWVHVLCDLDDKTVNNEVHGQVSSEKDFQNLEMRIRLQMK